jgi:hypothetical protein
MTVLEIFGAQNRYQSAANCCAKLIFVRQKLAPKIDRGTNALCQRPCANILQIQFGIEGYPTLIKSLVITNNL